MVQIRIKKTLSEGLLYVKICSKEINKLKRRNDSDRGYSGGHQFSGTVFYGRVIYTMIDISKLSKRYSVRVLE